MSEGTGDTSEVCGKEGGKIKVAFEANEGSSSG